MESTEVTNEVVETSSESADTQPVKKKFVPPVISVPVDVLEATTFFLPADSGAIPP